MEVLGRLGAALMAIGGILVGILGIMVWADAGDVAWYQGLSYLVVGVGLLLWGVPALFSRAESASLPGATHQRQSA